MPTHSKDEELTRRIGIRMREARQRVELSQAEAATRLGVPARTLRSWEHGEVSQPAWCVAQMARLYETSADYLLSPDRNFLALIDVGAEEEVAAAVRRGDTKRYMEASRVVSVLVTERLHPVSSRDEWHARMKEVVKLGNHLGGDHA